MGGEEFLIILHGCEAQDAIARAEHYRAAVEELNIGHSGSPLGHVTLSIGTSCLSPERSAPLQAWLGEADAAMYEAKAAGRNAVVARQEMAA
jgi:diguanylate cyclase (GGDEF)-like protein